MLDVSDDELTKLKLLRRDDKLELVPLVLEPVSLVLTLLESEALEPEMLRELVLISVVTLEPLESLVETLDKLRRLELKLVVLVVPKTLLGLNGGEFP